MSLRLDRAMSLRLDHAMSLRLMLVKVNNKCQPCFTSSARCAACCHMLLYTAALCYCSVLLLYAASLDEVQCAFQAASEVAEINRCSRELGAGRQLRQG